MWGNKQTIPARWETGHGGSKWTWGGPHGLGVVASRMPWSPSQMSSYWLDAVSWTAAAAQSPWLGGLALCQFALQLSDIFPCCCIPRVQRALVSQSSWCCLVGSVGPWTALSIVLATEATGWTAHVVAGQLEAKQAGQLAQTQGN